MPITSIDHILISMPAGREAEARAFYCGLLGLEEIVKPPALAKRGGCWFERGALKIHLGIDADFRPARKAHPAFIVQDLEGMAAALAKAGHSSKTDEPIKGYERIFVDDPFGNRIELMEPHRKPAS